MVVWFVNLGEREQAKQKYKSLFMKYSQLFKKLHTHYQVKAMEYEAIAKWRLFLTLLFSYFVRIQTIYFLFGKFLTYSNNKCNNNYFSICFGNIAFAHCTDLASSVGAYISGSISWRRSKKNSYYCVNSEVTVYS